MSNLSKFAVLATLLVAAPMLVQAAGFALVEQNASRLGNAYAGGAAESDDASVIFFNPAGMTYLEGRQVSVSGLVFLPKVEFNNGVSTSVVGTPMTGDNGGSAASKSLIPNFYYVDSLGSGLKYGFAVTAPAGVQIKYDTNWVGRYYSTGSSLAVINFSPALASRLGPATSVGVALDIQYAHAKLSKAIDFGSLCLANAPAAICSSQGLVPQQADGTANVSGHDWAVGYHLGIQHELTADTRVGLLYRSKVSHNMDATATFSNVPSLMAAGFQTTGARTEITLPEMVSLSGMHALTPALTLLGDASWTRWSRFNELKISFANPPPSGDDITMEEWKDSWRYSLGANYQASSSLMWRLGLAHDQGPIPEGRRTPAIPDGTRNSLAIGANYKLSKSGSLDIAYSHLFIPNGSVSLSSPLQGTLQGNYTSLADIVALQFNCTF